MTQYKRILVSAAASAMIVSSLSAATATIQAMDDDNSNAVSTTEAANPITQIADAELANADKNITNPDAVTNTSNGDVKQIVYKPGADISQNSIVTLEVKNGYIAKSDNYYFKKDGNANTQLNFAASSSTLNAAGTGYTKLVFSAATDITTDTNMALSTDSTNIMEPAIIAAKGTPADNNVTIAITSVKTPAGIDNTGAIPTGHINAAQIQKAFAVTTKPAATSVISVQSGRKHFNSAGDTVDTPDENTSLYSYVSVIDNGSLVNNGTITVSSNVAPCPEISAVKKIGTNGTTTFTDLNTTTCTFKLPFTTTSPAGVYTDLNSAAGLKIEVDVNGTGKIDPSTWSTKVDVNGSVIGQQTVANFTSHKWTLDGTQFAVPYLSTASSYGTHVLLTNTTAQDAEVTMDVYADKASNGSHQTAPVCSDVSLPVLPANSTKLYSSSTINNAIEGKCAGFSGGNFRYMGEFTVTSPKGTVVPAAFQNDAATGGKRTMPVYKKDAAEGWRE